MNKTCQQVEYNKFTTRILSPCYQLEDMESLSELFRRRINELGISNSELARRAKKSRSYVGNIINETAPTKSGKYELSPESVKGFAKALEVDEVEILTAIGYATESATEDSHEILDIANISFHHKKLTKADQEEMLRLMRTVAAGVLAEKKAEKEKE